MNYALKEWPAAITALEQGEMLLLFRKGGISEKSSSFQMYENHALLFPSFEHQKVSMLKSIAPETERLSPYQSGEKIEINSWVEFREMIEVKHHSVIPDLAPFHIWTDEFLKKRFAWKPERPLFALVCFTRRFVTPLEIEYHSQYRGCKSWIDLGQNLSLPESISVHTEEHFKQTFDTLLQILD